LDIAELLTVYHRVMLQALELLVEKCLSSSVQQLSPAVGLRLVFESVASGIFLPGTDAILLVYKCTIQAKFIM